MKENSIIKLENNNKYIILDKLHFEGSVYYFCTKTETNERLVQDKIKFFIEKKEDNDYYLAEVQDKKLLMKLIKIIRTLS